MAGITGKILRFIEKGQEGFSKSQNLAVGDGTAQIYILGIAADKTGNVMSPEQFQRGYKMLNEALRLIRVFHDLNQTQLAEKLSISRSHLSEVESGKKTPSMDLLKKYSEVFDVPPSSLLYFSERLADNSLTEKTRAKIANKILKILDWLSDMELSQDDEERKSA